MIVGCDPGKSGALARLDHAGRLVDVADMPVVGTIISAHLLDEIVHNWIDPLADAPYGTAVIEDVHARPARGQLDVFVRSIARRRRRCVGGERPVAPLREPGEVEEGARPLVRQGREPSTRDRAVARAREGIRSREGRRSRRAALIAWWFWREGGER